MFIKYYIVKDTDLHIFCIVFFFLLSFIKEKVNQCIMIWSICIYHFTSHAFSPSNIQLRQDTFISKHFKHRAVQSSGNHRTSVISRELESLSNKGSVQ